MDDPSSACEGGTETFKGWRDSAFCRRQKRLQEGRSPYLALLPSLNVTDDCADVTLINLDNHVTLLLQVFSLPDGMVRLCVREEKPLRPRYRVRDVLTNKLETQRWKVVKRNEESVELLHGDIEVTIYRQPFFLEIRANQEVLMKLNARGLLYFEHTRQRNTSSAATVTTIEHDNDGLWEEVYDGYEDSKPNGPTSIGLDISLPNVEHVYGIPQRATSLRLKATSNGMGPYRLYNLDVFGYPLDNPGGLYGSVPLLLAHQTLRTSAIFWLNGSETWVDISGTWQQSWWHWLLARMLWWRRVKPETNVRWMSESGEIDVFLLLGPSPKDVFRQYSSLTGTLSLPPLFALGYHQCRWNYEDEDDVRSVDAGFDAHEIPCDVVWLDIEHTEGKRYFTWDHKRFGDPIKLQQDLGNKGRKMVTIVNPHIRLDDDYDIYSEAKQAEYFVKQRDGQDFVGNCWPGPSSYLDFSNPSVRHWYADKFSYSKYKGSTEFLFSWNDMNEPSVFHSPEKTMPKDLVHHGGWEHRDLHNLFGYYQQQATAEGLINRSGGIHRPFVLTRSFFAGSQRNGAVWTGDNLSEWGHLKTSLPMLLSLSICGISFCGADVGGFFKDPESPELLVRWYQASAFQPFFRGHSSMSSVRREPWLFGEENTELIRRAISQRYALLPYWYTTFYHAHCTGEPIMRPLWVEYPSDIKTFVLEDEYMIGSALLVRPVVEPSAKSVQVYLPGNDENWYDVHSFQRHKAPCILWKTVTLSSIPVYQKGGTIVPRKAFVKGSSVLQRSIPYVLFIAHDAQGNAKGQLFADDEYSFDYQKYNCFLLCNFTYSSGTIMAKLDSSSGEFCTQAYIESLVSMGEACPSKVTLLHTVKEERCVKFDYDTETQCVKIEGLNLPLSHEWTVCIS
uniref:neutral alpha-glucosidase C-like isoform X2 n=1 Tax=Myxine glutinosa TaxID=7769 RepID=UPI00358F6546